MAKFEYYIEPGQGTHSQLTKYIRHGEIHQLNRNDYETPGARGDAVRRVFSRYRSGTLFTFQLCEPVDTYYEEICTIKIEVKEDGRKAHEALEKGCVWDCRKAEIDIKRTLEWWTSIFDQEYVRAVDFEIIARMDVPELQSLVRIATLYKLRSEPRGEYWVKVDASDEARERVDELSDWEEDA